MKNRFTALLLSLVVVAAALAGCGGAKQPTTQEPAPASNPAKGADSAQQTTYPITLKDAAGRDITIPAEPKRIISVAPSNTELLFALGKGSSLVGRSDFCDYPAEAKQITSIGGFAPPNYEKILSLKPDLVLLIGGSVEARTKLTEEYKLNTFVVDPQNFEELYKSIQTLGKLVNAQPQAEKLVTAMQAATKAVADKAAKATTKPVVFYQVWDDPLMTTGPSTFMDDMIRLAGGTNAAGGVKDRWANFSQEQFVAANPEIIITANPDAATKAKARQGWESIKAVKAGKVFGAPDENLLVRPGPRLVEGLKWMAQQVHPELFAQ